MKNLITRLRKYLYYVYLLIGAIIVALWWGFHPAADSMYAVDYMRQAKNAYSQEEPAAQNKTSHLRFRNEKLLEQHYQKHGREMGFPSPRSYEQAAGEVAENRKSLHKKQRDDGDDVYFLESGNDFVVVSGDGYIRTYFRPHDGINYYNRQ
jgi:pyocin large subunit-like protein